jgi:hypothetical protein
VERASPSPKSNVQGCPRKHRTSNIEHRTIEHRTVEPLNIEPLKRADSGTRTNQRGYISYKGCISYMRQGAAPGDRARCGRGQN